MKFGILCHQNIGSPKILADSLKFQLERLGHSSEIILEIDLMNRLVSYKNNTLSFHFWLKEILSNRAKDRQVVRQLRNMDAVVICACIPNAFWKRLYNVEKLKSILEKPVLIYEVYSLANAPTQIQLLASHNEPLFERYDAHLYISPVTEIKTPSNPNSFAIGIVAQKWNLLPTPKKQLIALIDFAQYGFEVERDLQMSALNRVGIDFIALDRKYSIDEIRAIYQESSIYFMQSPEAFGLPILECLIAGAQVFTPDSSWPMSWRLEDNPKVHGKGSLPTCFTIYEDGEDLIDKLNSFKLEYNLEKSPQRVFDSMIKNYPFFYNGNDAKLQECINYIKSKG